MTQRLFRLTVFFCLFAMLIIARIPALAQTLPTISVAPVWRPGTQLDTVDAVGGSYPDADVGDDYRYVDIEIYVSGNVQFWAAELTCTVNKLALDGYVTSADPQDPGDDVPMVRLGADWGPVEGTDYSQVITPYNDATGVISFAATKLGGKPPMGLNGVNYTLLLATLRFRVQPLTANTTSTLACTPLTFLDRNGVRVVTVPAFAAPKSLNLLTGYTLTGAVKYQGVMTPPATAGIGIQCDYRGAGVDPAAVRASTATGVFTLSNLRQFGTYTCRYFGNITTAEPAASAPTAQEDAFLSGTTDINLMTSSYALLPVELKAGNQAMTPPTPPTFNEVIDIGDLGLVTGNWTPGTSPTAFTNGDVNGDKLVNEVDLAIVGANYGLGEALPATTGLTYTHILYGLARDYAAAFPNSHIWRGDPSSGAVVVLGATNTRDFWPTLSPDGTKIAFVRYVAAVGATPARYELYTANVATPTMVTDMTPPTFVQNAFAPSWSPDGQRIAFICSTDANAPATFNNGYQFNHGSVCVVDADGRNFRTIATKAKIYPPAWYGNNVLIYAGHPVGPLGSGVTANPVCADRLCYFDFTKDAASAIARVDPTDLEFGGGTVIDMPVIRAVDTNSDGVPDDYWLFYRFDDSVNVKIRATSSLTYTGGVFDVQPFQASNPTVHGDLTTDGSAAIDNNVDYYAVSQPAYNGSATFPGLNVVYYRFSSADIAFYNSYYDPVTSFRWTAPVGHTVDGYVGNPSWTGDPDNPTDLHALRATMEWLP